MTTKSNAWTQGVRFSKLQPLLEARVLTSLARLVRLGGPVVTLILVLALLVMAPFPFHDGSRHRQPSTSSEFACLTSTLRFPAIKRALQAS
ncbi:hypothetical protein BR93DRAFT_56905 [Coniochaeta sp. PMI_546]|nr:hypothetical protein BR93DRAFT_56905 [Coniochaeta sp. PMI_546]